MQNCSKYLGNSSLLLVGFPNRRCPPWTTKTSPYLFPENVLCLNSAQKLKLKTSERLYIWEIGWDISWDLWKYFRYLKYLDLDILRYLDSPISQEIFRYGEIFFKMSQDLRLSVSISHGYTIVLHRITFIFWLLLIGRLSRLISKEVQAPFPWI